MLNSKNVNRRFCLPYASQLNPFKKYFGHFKAVLALIHKLPRNNGELKTRMCETLNNDAIIFAGWFNNMRKYIQYDLARREVI